MNLGLHIALLQFVLENLAGLSLVALIKEILQTASPHTLLLLLPTAHKGMPVEAFYRLVHVHSFYNEQAQLDEPL